MSENFDCQKLGEELDKLKKLKGEFDLVYAEGVEKGDLSGCKGLYRELKELLIGGESEIAKMLVFKKLLEDLKLEEQYESQLNVARESGLFESNQEGEDRLPFIEYGDNRYQMPTWSEVQKILSRNVAILKEKSGQGFTKMLIVPFAYDLKTMADKFKEKVLELDQTDNGIFGAGGERVVFNHDVKYPVHIWLGWDFHDITYYPKFYDQKNHGGMTKEEVIKMNGAWQLCFVEDMPVIPEKGKEIGGRKQIDRNGSCIKWQVDDPSIYDYKEVMENWSGKHKKQMENPSKYSFERGMTGEQYLWMSLTSLLSKEDPILMDYENNELRGCYLSESYFVNLDFVYLVGWYPNVGNKRHLGKICLNGTRPVKSEKNFGFRTSVNLKK